MTKNTKKNLTWKLTELPTAGHLADLVKSEVISKEEAREIMFGSAENDKEKVKALEELVKFLEDLVKDLSKNRTTYTPFHHTFYYNQTPYWDKYWDRTYEVLCSAGLSVVSGPITTTAKGKTNSFAISKSSGGVVGNSYSGIVDTNTKPIAMMTVSNQIDTNSNNGISLTNGQAQ